MAEEVPLIVNGDMATNLKANRQALRRCNDDKAALRDWASKVERKLR